MMEVRLKNDLKRERIIIIQRGVEKIDVLEEEKKRRDVRKRKRVRENRDYKERKDKYCEKKVKEKREPKEIKKDMGKEK